METRLKLKFGIILILVIFWNSVNVCAGAEGNVTETPTPDNTTTTDNSTTTTPATTDNATTLATTDKITTTEEITATDFCVNNECANLSPCINGDSNYTCNCTEGWEGWLCNEDKDDCLSLPCVNNGVCTDNGTNSFTCNCTLGWMGDTCSEDVNECEDDPCVNGQCLQDVGTGNFSCACVLDYRGPVCNQTINDCDPDPCINGGNCTDGVGNYTCDCPSGYHGRNCELDVPECDESPCQNGGYCQELIGSYKCHCDKTWSGDNCTEDFDECTEECQGQGFNCTNTNGSYLCECSHGYRKLNDMCIEIVMIPDKADGTAKTITMVNTVHRLETTSIPYYKQLYTNLFVSTNGYITFGERLEMSYPPSNLSDWSEGDKYKILAPYWWMNDIPDTQNSGVVISEYSSTSKVVSDSDDLEMFSQIVRGFDASKSTFAAEYVVMVTWHQFTPFPASINKEKLSITYQLVYITNGKQAFAVLNYGQLWPHSEGRSVASFLTGPTTEQIKQFKPEMNKRMVMPLFENNEELQNPDMECHMKLAKYSAYYQGMSETGMNLMKDRGMCPCSLDQAELDPQFEMDSEDTKQKCFIQVLFHGDYEKQLCCYEISSGSLNIFQSNHGYNIPKNTALADLVKDSRTICCGENSTSCSLFTSTVRRSSCNYYHVTTGIIFGDPHFRTVDGNYYIFNGRGEYYVIKSQYQEMKLDVQIRTGLVKVTGGEIGEATQIVGIAVKYHDSANLEFMMDTANLKLYMDGMEQTSDVITDSMVAKKIDTHYIVILNNGQSLKIQPAMDHMTFEIFGRFNDTKGLLGVANGDRRDDFTFSNGTVLPHDATEEKLFEFGQSWLVAMEEESLFNYTLIDGNFSTNQHPEFTPVFYGDKISNLTELFGGDEAMVNASAMTCGDQVACLVDYAATKNPDFAESTKMIYEKYMADTMKLGIHPRYMAEYYLRNLTYAKYGDNFEIKFDFMDISKFNVTIETNLEQDDWSLSDENVFMANSTSIKSDFYVRAVAENIDGLKTVNQPLLRLCFCQMEMQCVQNGDNIIDKCDCPSGRMGDYCQTEQVDVCRKCFDKALCNVSNTDSPCGCPEGMMGDGVNCYDEDECLTGRNECEQVCSNTIGNYTCSCRHGYAMSGMGTCTDIDECRTPASNNCTTAEYCVNEPGGFICPCRTMFKRDENHQCIEVVALYGGRVVFDSVPGRNQVWSPELEDKTSTEFKQLSQDVEKAIKETLEKNPELKDSLVKISVVKFMMKSDGGASRKKRAVEPTKIEAEFEAAFKEEIPGKTLEDSIVIGFQDCTSNSACTFGTLIGVDKDGTTLSSNYDLCETDNNICQRISTTCQSSSGTYTCHCRQGYEKWNQFTHACQDIDECLVAVKNTTVLREMCGDQGMACINQPGTYSCRCTADYTYNNDTKCTLTNYCKKEPCKNGAKCENVWGDAKYACKCNYGWTGVNCQDEDEEAEKQRIIIIAVSATLGVICFILLLVLVLICTKRKKSSHHASINMEEYSSFKGIPRASLHGQDNPMMENGSTHSSNDLDIQAQKKQTEGGRTTIFNHQLLERRESNPSSSDDHLRIYADPDVPLYINQH